MQTPVNYLLQLINKGTSPFHVVRACLDDLNASGFQRLSLEEEWRLTPGGRYYVSVYGSTLFAFAVGNEVTEDYTFRILSAHTDHPCLHIKPAAEYTDKSYLRLNVECYGGLIKNTWLDRPLSIAGKVALKSGSVFHPEIRLFDSRRPLLTIPNLAIHMNRDVNKGTELNNQTHMIPLFGLMQDSLPKTAYFMDFLADEMKVSREDILDFDLCVYNQEEGCLLGRNQELVSAPRLDNLTSVAACIHGILAGGNEKTIRLACLFDNEEIGSRTKQGADSVTCNLLLKKINDSLPFQTGRFPHSLLKSHMVSLDVAHGYHPNYPGVCDPTSIPELGKGIAIKMNSSQKYATDSEAVAILMQLCEAGGLPFQKYVNRSDIAGGSTLGSLTSSWIPVLTADVGAPILAMHSARELMAACDQETLQKLAGVFFSL